MTDRAASLAAELEADIRAGRLLPGARLPTHRALAEARGVAVNTVTKAMRLLAARGLAVGEVGRGSFVRAPAQADAAAFRIEGAAAGVVDLSRNAMPLSGLAARFHAAAVAVLRREPALAGYQYLPRGLRADAAVQRALAAGVQVAPGDAFAVGRAPNAVRLSLGAPERREDLERALRDLSAALTA